MNDLSQILNRKGLPADKFLSELNTYNQQIEEEIKKTKHNVRNIEDALNREDMPQLSSQVLSVLGLSSPKKPELIGNLMSKDTNVLTVQIASRITQIECLDRLKTFLQLNQKFKQEKSLAHQIELLADIDKQAYRFLCQKLKNEQILSRVATIMTKHRQSIDHRLQHLVRRDINSILFNIAEIHSVARLITNIDTLYFITYCPYDSIVELSAISNELTFVRYREERTPKFLTLHIDRLTVNPKNPNDIDMFLKELEKSVRLAESIEKEIISNISDQNTVKTLEKYKKSLLKDIVEDILPIFYFMDEEQTRRTEALLQCGSNILYSPSIPHISTLLIRLKHAIHKADLIEPLTEQLVKHLRIRNDDDMQHLYFFLETAIKMTTNDFNNLSMFLITTLLDRLEDEMDYDTVTRLLTLRESIRKNIYQRFGQ